MTEERQAPDEPSKLAITQLLAEVEVRRARSVRYSLLGLLLPLVAGAALLFYAFQTVRQKLEEKTQLDGEIATARGEIVSLKKRSAELESEKASLAGTVKAVEYAAGEAAQNNLSSKALEAVIRQAIASNPRVAEAAPFVFIHINDEPQRGQEVRAASDALKRAGFDVRGIETIPPFNVPATEVRYFRREDKALADKAVAALNNAKLPNAGANLSQDLDASPGRLELWFAPSPAQADPAKPPGTTDNRRAFTKSEVTNQAVITSMPKPGYTEEAYSDKVEGKVTLRMILSASGEVTDISVVKGLPSGLTEKAIAAARQIKFLPAQKDGRKVSQYITLEYPFKLDDLR